MLTLSSPISMKKILPFIALIMTCCVSGNGSIALPNGYMLFTANALEHGIVDPGGSVVVGPNVCSYAISGDIIIGEVKVPPEGYPSKYMPSLGYFLIDTKSASITTGLTHDMLANLLKNYGLRSVPALLSTQ